MTTIDCVWDEKLQEDSSVMVGMMISDTVKEKQFVFIIKNETLSYTVTP